MELLIFRLAVLHCLVVLFVKCDIHSNRWDNDLYSGRQFDDIITGYKTHLASSEVIRPTVLAMYTPECETILLQHGLTDLDLPRYQYMVFAKYDYVSSPNYIWYQSDARDDLVARYKPKACLEYFYFANGTFHDQDEPERYVNLDKTAGKDVQTWMWNKLLTDVSVTNNRDNDVIVKFTGHGRRGTTFSVPPGETREGKAYISNIMTINDVESWDFLYGEVLADTTKTYSVVVTSDMELMDPQWIRTTDESERKKSQEMRDWRWYLSASYLEDFKQPVILPKFTDLGYKKSKIPEKLYAQILDFYRKNSNESKSEHGSETAKPIINFDKVGSNLVQFSPEMIKIIVDGMQPIMEEWVNIPLQHTYLYGIREYFRGNLLRNHVDKVNTHVVSAILQIDKDLEGQPDWELEVIGFDGIRKNVTLNPGDMLYYESTTLIHGRPFPLQGRVFANAFLHYKPVTGWDWIINHDSRYLTYNGKNVEDVYKFASDTTYKAQINREKFQDIYHRSEL